MEVIVDLFNQHSGDMKELKPEITYGEKREGLGSIIVIVATDAPFIPNQLKRIARRVPIGISRVGGYIFIAGLINDVVTGLPTGISSFNYLLLCGFAAYLRTITLRPNIIKDWFFFLFTILVVNSLSYSILYMFFSIDLNYYNLFINIFFTFIFYLIFANIFLMYQNKFFKEKND